MLYQLYRHPPPITATTTYMVMHLLESGPYLPMHGMMLSPHPLVCFPLRFVSSGATDARQIGVRTDSGAESASYSGVFLRAPLIPLDAWDDVHTSRDVTETGSPIFLHRCQSIHSNSFIRANAFVGLQTRGLTCSRAVPSVSRFGHLESAVYTPAGASYSLCLLVLTFLIPVPAETPVPLYSLHATSHPQRPASASPSVRNPARNTFCTLFRSVMS